MKKTHHYFTIGCLVIASSLNAAVLFHSELKWRTAETDNFYIHYYEGEEEIIQTVGNYAEYIHRILTEKYKWKPSGKTHIVVSETEDFANGMATVFPYNTIYIILTQPGVDSVIGFYDNWLYLLLVHEYTHIIQLDQARGPAGLWRYVFGRTPFTLLPPFTTFPNALMPGWLIEGLATYEESAQTDAGRVKSSLMNSMMEYAVKENKLPSIGTGSGDVIEWPWHNYHYFYGSRFYEFISEKFGESTIPLFHENYSKQFFPLMLNYNSSKILGYPLTWLWNSWLEEEKKIYGGTEPVTVETESKITDSGYFTRGVRISRDGRFLVYMKINPSEYPSVYLYSLDEKKEKRLFFRNFGNDFCWDLNSKGFYFTQVETFSSFYTYSDLYYYSLEDRSIKPVTERRRITEFDLSPDGKTGAGIIYKNGKRIPVLIDLEDNRIIELFDGTIMKGFYNPRFSRDGRRIVFVEWNGHFLYEISWMDLEKRELNRLPLPIAFNIFPLWNGDGNGIYFSSDMEGTQKLYYYSLRENKLYRVDNIKRPVYEFDVSGDETTIYFTGYSAKGFDIYTVNLDRSAWQEVNITELQGRQTKEKDIPEIAIKKDSRYHGIKYIYPRFWMPLALYSGSDGWYFNAITTNSDPIVTHTYTLSAEYYGKYEIGGVNFNYQNDIFRPSTGLTYNYIPVLFDDTGSGESSWWRKNSGEFYINQIFKKFTYSFEIGAHYILTKYSPITFEKGKSYYTAGAGATLMLFSAKQYSLSPGRQDGVIFASGFRRYSKELGSDVDYYKTTFDLRGYFPVNRNTVISTRIASGLIWGESPGENFTAGGVIPRVESSVFGLDDTRLYLRGYPADILTGLNIIVETLEFRFPVVTLDTGLSTFPLFFQKIHASIFYDLGSAWNSSFKKRKAKDSAGIEIKFDSTIFYGYNITFTFGMAQGLKTDGIFEYYIMLGNSF